MQIKVTRTAFDIVNHKYFAFFDGGQLEITIGEKQIIDYDITYKGAHYLPRSWFDAFTGEKYEY